MNNTTIDIDIYTLETQKALYAFTAGTPCSHCNLIAAGHFLRRTPKGCLCSSAGSKGGRVGAKLGYCESFPGTFNLFELSRSRESCNYI